MALTSHVILERSLLSVPSSRMEFWGGCNTATVPHLAQPVFNIPFPFLFCLLRRDEDHSEKLITRQLEEVAAGLWGCRSDRLGFLRNVMVGGKV